VSAPPVVDARGVPDLRLWLMDQWRQGRTLHRYAAKALDHQSQLFRRPANPVRFAEEEVHDLQAATLWWVGAEMVELLMAAAAGIPDEVVQYDLPVPSRSGLVVFERPWFGLDTHEEAGILAIPDERAPEGRIAVDAVSWGPRRWSPVDVMGEQADLPPGSLSQPWYTGRSFTSYRRIDFAEGMSPGELNLATLTGVIEHGKRQHYTGDAPDGKPGYETWAPLGRSDWPIPHRIGDQPWRNSTLPPVALASFVEDRKVMAAFWTLIEQEGIATRREERPGRPAARRTERAGVDPELARVQVVLLRRARRTVEEPEEEHAKVAWSHRWLVEGFWRMQPVGKGRAQRRLTFVRPHVKGPSDKPLVVKQKVHAWTR
jgi:hypothetical protein